MKKVFFIIIALGVIFSCSNQTNKKVDESKELAVLTVEELLEQANKELVGKEIMIKGTVTHVCKHGGARCFIMGSTEDASIRIEAGEIGSFTQEQVGSEIQVKAFLQEVKLDEDDIAELEKSAAEGEVDDKHHALGHDVPSLHDVDGGNHDSINRAKKLADINQKLAESIEGYVPVYYLEGIELIVPEKK